MSIMNGKQIVKAKVLAQKLYDCLDEGCNGMTIPSVVGAVAGLWVAVLESSIERLKKEGYPVPEGELEDMFREMVRVLK